MKAQLLTRPKQCALCGFGPAVRGDLCVACRADDDFWESYEFPADNEPTCRDCGGVLSARGHCFDCLDRMCEYGPARMERAS